MTLRGHIQNGQVILDDPHDLPDGAEVEVHSTGGARERSSPPEGSAAAILQMLHESDRLAFAPGERERLEREVHEMREQDLKASLERGEWDPPRN